MTVPILRSAWSAIAMFAAWTASVLGQERVGPLDPYAEVAAKLAPFIEHEREDKQIPAICIALVDDQRIVWARGFGVANRSTGQPATASTIIRPGSISKLFTDIALMQLVEQGKVDLDAPVATYIPSFAVKNPHDTPITLRQMMSHRSGLVREPPRGHYFDLAGSSILDTVSSLNDTTLVHRPTTRTKYSNAAIATVGYVVERLRDKPFAECVQETVLRPAGMTTASFLEESEHNKNRAAGVMWTYDGRVFDAPPFRLGMLPAGDLHASVIDLGRFLSMLFAEGNGSSDQVLQPATLRSMWIPQFVGEGARGGFGLGFLVDEFEGTKRVGHGGAVYGFASELMALPDEKLGVIVVSSRDCANAVSEHIGEEALRLMRLAKASKPLPELRSTIAVPSDLIERIAGRYRSGDRDIDLIAREGRLFLLPSRGGSLLELKSLGEKLIFDGPLAYGTSVDLASDELTLGIRKYNRVPIEKPAPAPEAFRELIGEYGWDHNTLYLLERDGQLNALIEWFFLYPLTEVSKDHYRFPDDGMYDNQPLVIERDENGALTGVRAAEVLFPKRNATAGSDAPGKITPVRPVAVLRDEALNAKPPVESGEFRTPNLVDLATLDPTIKLDIRYASDNNFLSTPVYTSARAFLQKPAAEALLRAHQSLKDQGYGLLIHDAYRPWYVTKIFRDATPEKFHDFVADPAKGSRHNRGCAVDLSLYDLATGKPVEMVGEYDEFSHRSYPNYMGGTTLQRWHRELLRKAMEAQGFTVYEFEWWHFDYKDWQKYGIMNTRFEEL